jgi:hypothetical protein
MLERRIDPEEVRAVVERGQIVQRDSGDRPYPSFLVLCVSRGRPLHVAFGYDGAEFAAYVITTHEPDMDHWGPDSRTRLPRRSVSSASTD